MVEVEEGIAHTSISEASVGIATKYPIVLVAAAAVDDEQISKVWGAESIRKAK